MRGYSDEHRPSIPPGRRQQHRPTDGDQRQRERKRSRDDYRVDYLRDKHSVHIIGHRNDDRLDVLDYGDVLGHYDPRIYNLGGHDHECLADVDYDYVGPHVYGYDLGRGVDYYIDCIAYYDVGQFDDCGYNGRIVLGFHHLDLKRLGWVDDGKLFSKYGDRERHVIDLDGGRDDFLCACDYGLVNEYPGRDFGSRDYFFGSDIYVNVPDRHPHGRAHELGNFGVNHHEHLDDCNFDRVVVGRLHHDPGHLDDINRVKYDRRECDFDRWRCFYDRRYDDRCARDLELDDDRVQLHGHCVNVHVHERDYDHSTRHRDLVGLHGGLIDFRFHERLGDLGDHHCGKLHDLGRGQRNEHYVRARADVDRGAGRDLNCCRAQQYGRAISGNDLIYYHGGVDDRDWVLGHINDYRVGDGDLDSPTETAASESVTAPSATTASSSSSATDQITAVEPLPTNTDSGPSSTTAATTASTITTIEVSTSEPAQTTASTVEQPRLPDLVQHGYSAAVDFVDQLGFHYHNGVHYYDHVEQRVGLDVLAGLHRDAAAALVVNHHLIRGDE
ncbi:hypothetical protein H9P43_000737 [Blastocladiella emersonii ATCC 22665]|nr:hypothetical protein H9P43_000737 [Blastocladiella emersonii ATCC 22665]